MVKIGAIMTENEYEEALSRIEVLMDIPESDSTTKELCMLAVKVECYEDKLYPTLSSKQEEALPFRRKKMGVVQECS